MDIAKPGPWEGVTENNQIKADLLIWIEALLAALRSSVMEAYDFSIELESNDHFDGGAAAALYLYFPRTVYVLSCNVLSAMAEENAGLEAVVRAAFKTLYWFKYGYNFDDCFEEFQDWHGEQLDDLDLSEAERKAILQDIEEAKNEIPPEYRSLFRNDTRPEFPSFPECPPEDAWLNAWWHWAKKTAEVTGSWEAPIPDFLDNDSTYREQVDHGYLTPFLWNVPGRLMDFFWELLDSQAQSGEEGLMAFPIDTATQTANSLTAISRFSQWIELFIEASLLSDKDTN